MLERQNNRCTTTTIFKLVIDLIVFLNFMLLVYSMYIFKICCTLYVCGLICNEDKKMKEVILRLEFKYFNKCHMKLIYWNNKFKFNIGKQKLRKQFWISRYWWQRWVGGSHHSFKPAIQTCSYRRERQCNQGPNCSVFDSKNNKRLWKYCTKQMILKRSISMWYCTKNNFDSFENFLHLLMNDGHLNNRNNYTENNKLSVITKQREKKQYYWHTAHLM